MDIGSDNTPAASSCVRCAAAAPLGWTPHDTLLVCCLPLYKMPFRRFVIAHRAIPPRMSSVAVLHRARSRLVVLCFRLWRLNKGSFDGLCPGRSEPAHPPCARPPRCLRPCHAVRTTRNLTPVRPTRRVPLALSWLQNAALIAASNPPNMHEQAQRHPFHSPVGACVKIHVLK